LTAHALNPNAAAAADLFPAQVRDLLAWVAGEALVEGHPFRSVRAQPAGDSVPETWILGSSDYGAQVAAHFGLPFCFAHFITDGAGAAAAMSIYRERYRPSARHPAPYAAICPWAVAAESEAAAEELYTSRAVWRLSRDRGVFLPLPSPQEAAAHDWTDAERTRAERQRARAFVGTGAAVAAQLRALAQELGAQEVVVLTTTHDPAARQRSYACLAKGWGLDYNASATAEA